MFGFRNLCHVPLFVRGRLRSLRRTTCWQRPSLPSSRDWSMERLGCQLPAGFTLFLVFMRFQKRLQDAGGVIRMVGILEELVNVHYTSQPQFRKLYDELVTEFGSLADFQKNKGKRGTSSEKDGDAAAGKALKKLKTDAAAGTLQSSDELTGVETLKDLV